MVLEIVGAGFGRTGTKSLKYALETLGFGHCHHMDEIGANPKLLPDWISAASGSVMNWEKVFTGYRSTVDWPGARYWNTIANYFPNSKVILTTRNPILWHASILETIAASFRNRDTIKNQTRKAVIAMAYETVGQQIFDGKIDNPKFAIDIFNNHIRKVRSTIPADRLLVFDVIDGWEPLCSFLNVPKPEILFPHKNISADFAQRL